MLRRENFHSLPQFLDFAMLFEELIEQHRVHLIVAHAPRDCLRSGWLGADFVDVRGIEYACARSRIRGCNFITAETVESDEVSVWE